MLMDMHFKSENFIWGDDCHSVCCVAYPLGALGVLPRKVIGFNVFILCPAPLDVLWIVDFPF